MTPARPTPQARPVPEARPAAPSGAAAGLAGIVPGEAAEIPQDWLAGLNRLVVMPCPRVVASSAAWAELVRASTWLYASGTLAAAHGFGWDTLDLWGCDPAHPLQRLDALGLAWCMAASTVARIDRDLAIVVAQHGSELRYTRRPPRLRVAGIVPAWEITTGEIATGEIATGRPGA